MEDLIKALQILIKYENMYAPTHCSHDVLRITGVDIEDVSKEDIDELEKLSFEWDYDLECFYSYRFGSA